MDTIPEKASNGSQPSTKTTNPALGAAAPQTPPPRLTTSGLNVVAHSEANPTPTLPKLPKASTNIQWPEPVGLPLRKDTDEPLMVFRRAIGINSDLSPPHHEKKPGAAELGLRQPTGMYATIKRRKHKRKTQHFIMSWALNLLHFAQVVIGATLTALGPDAASHAVAITVLGALNTVIAGVLALMKGAGMPEKLHRDEVEFRKLQDWIEETEALLMTGVIGRDNRDIGVLVESAFRKYESAQKSVENNRPDNYVPDPGSTSHAKKAKASTTASSTEDTSEKSLGLVKS